MSEQRRDDNAMKKFLKVSGIVILLLVGLWVVTGFGLMAYFHLARPESPVVDDGDLRIMEPAIADGENAYVAFLSTTNALACPPEDKSVLTAYGMYCAGKKEPFKLWRKDGTPETCRAEVDRILAERAEGLDGLHRAFQLPRYRMTPDPDGLFFPPISTMTWAHSLLRASASRARQRGDLPAAFKAECDGLRFGILCRDNASSVVECLVGASLSDNACRRMVQFANDESISDDLLTSVAEFLKADFDEKALFEQTIKREYVNFGCRVLDQGSDRISLDELWQLLQDQVSAFIPSELRKSSPPAPWFLKKPCFVRFSYNKEMTKQDMVNVFRAGLTGRNPEEVVPTPKSPLQPNWAGRILARIVTPAFDDLHRKLKESLFALRAARTAVAVRRHCRAHAGVAPADLAALVPTYLNEVPRDPFAPSRALGYDAAGNGLVWTVGEDGTFNPQEGKVESYWKLNRALSKYAMRLDGKPHETRKTGNSEQ